MKANMKHIISTYENALGTGLIPTTKPKQETSTRRQHCALARFV